MSKLGNVFSNNNNNNNNNKQQICRSGLKRNIFRLAFFVARLMHFKTHFSFAGPAQPVEKITFPLSARPAKKITSHLPARTRADLQGEGDLAHLHSRSPLSVEQDSILVVISPPFQPKHARSYVQKIKVLYLRNTDIHSLLFFHFHVLHTTEGGEKSTLVGDKFKLRKVLTLEKNECGTHTTFCYLILQ